MGEWLGPVFEANALGEPAPPAPPAALPSSACCSAIARPWAWAAAVLAAAVGAAAL